GVHHEVHAVLSPTRRFDRPRAGLRSETHDRWSVGSPHVVRVRRPAGRSRSEIVISGYFSTWAGLALGMRRGPRLASRSDDAPEIENIDQNETGEMRGPDMCLAGAVHHRLLRSKRDRGIERHRNGGWHHYRGYVHDDGHCYRHRRRQARTHTRDAEWPPG